LKTEIANGRWGDALPGERSLASTLRVSRRTITAALIQLRKADIIKSEAGRGHRLMAARGRAPRRQPGEISLLTPATPDAMRPGTMLWVNELQAMLGEAGYRLSHFYSPKYFSRQPGRALMKLVGGNPRACWILAGSTVTSQRWFARQKIPAVVAGTCHQGVGIPDVDLDYVALGRHLGGRLAACRHRKAAMLLTQSPGYFTSETATMAGFREILERTGGEALAVYHERTRDGLVRVLHRLFSSPNHPTAVVTISSLDYLTATSFLTQQGLRIPQDVSVVARNDDAFMNALLPEPTRYHASSHVFAQHFFKLSLQMAEGPPPLRPNVRIMPDFITGASLGPAPAPAGCARMSHAGS
jgi:LacI family transcriptional regulator